MTFTSKVNKSLQDLFKAPLVALDELFIQAQTLTKKTFNRQISVFSPGPLFPSISITGTQCQLQCQHCYGHFLHQMQAIKTPEALIHFCDHLAQRKGIGCLISGGCDKTGAVPLSPFVPALTKIKQSTNLFLNVHTGFLNKSQAYSLSQTGIDCASVDIVGDDSTIQTVYGLSQRTTQDYTSTLKILEKHRIPTAPHICVGLHNGQLLGELHALKLIKSAIKPKLLVIIAFMPTQGTPMADCPAPEPYDVARICAITRLLFPTTEIALGCMRPRGSVRRQIEKLAVQAGITRLVQPTKATLHYLAKNNYSISKHNACCVM